MTRLSHLTALLALAFIVQPLALAEEAYDVEAALGRVLDEHGSAELVLEQGGLTALSPDTLTQSYARALLELGRGREITALRLVDSALAGAPVSGESEGEASLRAALLWLMLDLGPSQRGRQILAGGQDPLTELAHAALLASEKRCQEALPIVERVRSRAPALAGSTLLLTRSLASCAREGEALALLQAEADTLNGSSTPRFAMAAGALLLQVGDHASASHWCSLARENAGALAPFRHQAAVCAAAADAFRGLLPAARDEFIEARKGEMRDPAVPLARRSRAGLSAAWTILAGEDPADARLGLEVLDELGVLRLPTTEGDAVTLLRALALGRLERSVEADRELARVSGASRTNLELGALEALVRARLRQREGDQVAAGAAIEQALAASARAGMPEIAAEALLVRARLAARTTDVDAVADAAVEALEAWPRSSFLSASAFADPVLPRRAMEMAASLGWSARGDADGLVERRLVHAERARRAFLGTSDKVPEVDDLDSLGRRLADRDAALVAYLVGETRVFAWLVEPAGVRMLEFPTGSELRDRLLPILAAPGGRYLGPSSWGERLLDSLLGGVASGSMLFVVPDGFLEGVPWSILGAGLERSNATGEATALLPPSVLPSLGALVQAPAVTVMEQGDRARLVLVGPSVLWSRDPSLEGTLARFGAVETLGTRGEGAEALLSGLGRGSELLHVGLPLLAAGETPARTFFFVPADGGLRKDPEDLTIERLFQIGREHDVIVFASREGWSQAPDSLVSAAGEAIHGGARAALVLVLPEEGAPIEIWTDLYGSLASGETLADAVAGLIARHESVGVPFVQIVGDAGGRLMPEAANPLPFYITLGAGILLLSVALFRFLRTPRDPFDVEPPEED